MTLELDPNRSLYQIRAYRPGEIWVNEQCYTHSLLISPKQLIHPWRPLTISELTYQDLQQAVALSPDLILLGTGESLVFPDLMIYGDLVNQKIGIEIMSTAAAARTFAALTAESRNVVAALFP